MYFSEGSSLLPQRTQDRIYHIIQLRDEARVSIQKKEEIVEDAKILIKESRGMGVTDEHFTPHSTS
jgi:hypothetical protein